MQDHIIIEKLSEYLSIARFLTEFSPTEEYQRANELAFWLCMYLEPHLLQDLGRCLKREIPPYLFADIVRKQYGDGETIGDKFLLHAPGIGKKEKP